MVLLIFLYPQLSQHDFYFIRLFGGGLGNLLFPWARAVSLGNKYGLPLIYPTWPQIKIGSYLRKEKDKRHYFGLFKPSKDYIYGSKRIYYLTKLPRINETAFFQDPEYFQRQGKDLVVITMGYEDYFEPILTRHELIKTKLYDMVHPERIPKLDNQPFLAVHVRLGDFKVGKQTTPLVFFETYLSQIRDRWPNIQIMVFTDGGENEICSLLQKYNAKNADFGSSISDMLAMSCAKLLIASKNSTFSWWASYLGRMPVIWPKDTTTKPIYHDNESPELYLGISEVLPDMFFDNSY